MCFVVFCDIKRSNKMDSVSERKVLISWGKLYLKTTTFNVSKWWKHKVWSETILPEMLIDMANLLVWFWWIFWRWDMALLHLLVTHLLGPWRLLRIWLWTTALSIWDNWYIFLPSRKHKSNDDSMICLKQSFFERIVFPERSMGVRIFFNTTLRKNLTFYL